MNIDKNGDFAVTVTVVGGITLYHIIAGAVVVTAVVHHEEIANAISASTRIDLSYRPSSDELSTSRGTPQGFPKMPEEPPKKWFQSDWAKLGKYAVYAHTARLIKDLADDKWAFYRDKISSIDIGNLSIEVKSLGFNSALEGKTAGVNNFVGSFSLVTNEKYSIQKGETLTSIGEKFGVAVSDLMTMNNISEKNKDVIYAGDDLIIGSNTKTYNVYESGMVIEQGTTANIEEVKEFVTSEGD